MKKTILISIDGMRPDGLMQSNSPYLEKLKSSSSYTFNAKTVFPSITLPCHLSMFHSIPPQRHGTLSNTYATPVRPVNGLFEELKANRKKSAMFYGWEPIRNIGKAGSLTASEYIHARSVENTDEYLTDRAIECINTIHPDFVFLYLVETDEKGGHDNGWMSDAYIEYIRKAITCTNKVIELFGEEYTIIITSDHGGHDRTHGTDSPEDMTIPMFFMGEDFKAGKELSDVSILDIAPTIADVLGIEIPYEWEGKSLLRR